jgi:hypothetical protein
MRPYKQVATKDGAEVALAIEDRDDYVLSIGRGNESRESVHLDQEQALTLGAALMRAVEQR